MSEIDITDDPEAWVQENRDRLLRVLHNSDDDRAGAILSDDRTYRYQLWRTWDTSKPRLGWIMLNPSTADETEDDQTIRRCIGYAKDWDYGSMVVGNLFAYRTRDPSELWNRVDIVGPENDRHLREICQDAEMVVAAWGAYGSKMDRGPEVRAMLDVDLYALETTKHGEPVHPLYQPADAEPFPLGGEPR